MRVEKCELRIPGTLQLGLQGVDAGQVGMFICYSSLDGRQLKFVAVISDLKKWVAMFHIMCL